MALSTIDELELALTEAPAVFAFVKAVQASVATHKGEGGLDEGLDVAVDVMPQFRDLVKEVEAKWPK